MQLNQFKFLVAVSQYGSISRAAQELYISQSTVSLALINLEEELGITILNRSKRGVSFTAEGKQVLQRAMEIMEALERMQNVGQDGEELTGEVRIGGSSHISMNLITEMMIQIHRLNPGICILAQRKTIREIIKEMAQKELDLGLIGFNTLNEPDIQAEIRRYNLEFTPVFTDRLRICVGEQHPLYGRESVSLQEVLQYNFASLAFRMDEFLLNYFRQFGYQREPVSINDLANLRKYVANTDAMLVMPETEIENSNRTYRVPLYGLNVPEFDLLTTLGWLHHGDHDMTVLEQYVIEQLERECQRFQDMNSGSN